MDDSQADVHYNIANAYFLTEQFDDALEHYRRAIALNDSKPESHYNMGNAYCKLGSYQEAVDAYTKALESDFPAQAQVLYNLGNALFLLEKFEEAVDAYTKALAINESTLCHYNIAVAYSDLGQLDKAAEHYQEAINMDEANVEAYMSLADILVKLNRNEEAMQAYAAVLEQDPDNMEARE